MRVLHVIPSLSPRRGGPSFALPLLARGLTELGVDVDVVTTDDDGPSGHLEVPLRVPIDRDGVTYRHFHRTTSFYSTSASLTSWVASYGGHYDLIHIHALFTYCAIPAAVAARSRGVPYVVRPLGTLGRWSIERRRPRLKALSFRLLESRIVSGAAAVHYTSEQEKREASMLGVSTKSIVVPVPVDSEIFDVSASREAVESAAPGLEERPYLLFLSRLDRKKGLDLLLPAFARARTGLPELALVIAGDGDATLRREIESAACQLGIESDVFFTGHLSGENKVSALRNAVAFVLPSYNENFGVAPVEAMAAGTPVVLTDRVGISSDVISAGAGLVVEPDAGQLSNALSTIASDAGLRASMSCRGRALVRSRYSVNGVARMMRSAYEELVP